jgi:hypothetical protein
MMTRFSMSVFPTGVDVDQLLGSRLEAVNLEILEPLPLGVFDCNVLNPIYCRAYLLAVANERLPLSASSRRFCGQKAWQIWYGMIIIVKLVKSIRFGFRGNEPPGW